MDDSNVAKRVFLRKILYRMDFQLITEKIQEELFQYVAEKYNFYFSNQGNELESVDIEISPLNSSIPKMNTRKQNVFVLFHSKDNDNDGRIIKIGKTFIMFELDLDIVSYNICYYEWFSDIITYIIQKTQMFRPVRIALRKFNWFYILDEHKHYLDDIFQISFYTKANVANFELEQMNEVQVYDINNYKLNFSREYSTGILNNDVYNNRLAHLIGFDFDLYSTDLNVLKQFIKDPKKGLTEMNNNIYRFFTSIIKDDIVMKINKGELLDQFEIIPF